MTPHPVIKTVGGVTFEDPFAHLQADTEEALEWQWREADRAAAAVQALPHYQELVREVAGAFESRIPVIPILRAGWWYSAEMAPDFSGHRLVRRREIAGEPAVICEPAELEGSSERPAFVYKATPSPDGRYVIATVLPGGSLDSATYVVDVQTGRRLEVKLEALVFLGFAEPCWLPDSTGFVIGDRAPDRRHRVRRVRITAAGVVVDDHIFEPSEVSFDLPVLTHHVSPGGRYSIGVAAPHERRAVVIGDLRTGDWRRFLPEGFEAECHGDWLDDQTYAAIETSQSDRGRLVAIPVETSCELASWREILAAGDPVLRTLIAHKGRGVHP